VAKRTTRLLIVMVLLAGVGYLVLWVRQHGFSALEKPSRFEQFLARHARKIATPSGARELKNPYPASTENLASAREHFAEHCASCHGFDGRGNTVIGRNLYPKAPDMTDAQTQNLAGDACLGWRGQPGRNLESGHFHPSPAGDHTRGNPADARGGGSRQSRRKGQRFPHASRQARSEAAQTLEAAHSGSSGLQAGMCPLLAGLTQEPTIAGRMSAWWLGKMSRPREPDGVE